MDVINDKLNHVGELAEKIDRATTIEDTAEVAIELYSTLGFCHGFLMKDSMKVPKSGTPDFPWDKATWVMCSDVYDKEYYNGIQFREDM